MQRKRSLKALCLSTIITLSSSSHATETTVLNFATDLDLVNYTLKNIRTELPKRNGNPLSVFTHYKMTEKNEPILIETKIYYSDYHKGPDSFSQSFRSKQTNTVSRIVDVVYKLNNKNHVTVVERHPETKKLIERKHVEINA